MARLTRAESMANTRTALLAAAEAEFARAGYHATTIERIVERADFTRGAFYTHFADKADLFLALVDDQHERHLHAMRDQLTDHEWDDHHAFIAWFERGTQAGGIERAFAEFRSVAASTPAYAARLASQLRAAQATAAELIRAAATATGVQLTMAPEDFATIATALVDGYTVRHRLDPTNAPPHLLSEAIELLWRAATRQP